MGEGSIDCGDPLDQWRTVYTGDDSPELFCVGMEANLRKAAQRVHGDAVRKRIRRLRPDTNGTLPLG